MRKGKKTAKVMSFALLMVLLASTVLTATSCTTYDNFKEAFFSDNGVAADTVRIGILEPQTGNDSKYGELEIQGIELAHEMVPEVLGKEVELVYGDTQSNIYVAESASDDLIAKKPAVVLGTYGDAASLLASRHLGEAKIPAITITATNPLITANNEYYFRMAFTDASQGKALADYVYNGLKQSESAIIRVKDDDSSAEIISAFSKNLRKLTGSDACVKTTIELEPNKNDAKAEVQALMDAGAKSVFMPISLKNAEKVFKAAQELGAHDINFIGPKSWLERELISFQSKYPKAMISVASDVASKDSVASVSAGTDGDVVSSEPMEKAAPGVYENFLKAYKEKYRNDNPPEATALAFDAYMIAVSAIEKAGSVDGYLIKDALKGTSNFEGVSGLISFDESGEPTKTINVDKIIDGRFVSVYTAK